ncbi:hypothetical protein AHAS_Ahas11G0188900 [Arachis hypogaea]
MWVWHVRSWAWHTSNDFQKGMFGFNKGVARHLLGVARQYHFPMSNIEGHKRGMARQAGRATLSPSHTMGVPLEPLGVARQFINPEGDNHLGVPLEDPSLRHASSSPSLRHAT